MGDGDDNAKQDNNDDAYTAPEPSPVAQTMIDALSYGPTGYSEDIMRNLGMDVVNPGYQGGPRPTSAMTADPVMGYQPRPAQSDPLVAALAKGPATPATVDDLYMKYGAGTASGQSNGEDDRGWQHWPSRNRGWRNQ